MSVAVVVYDPTINDPLSRVRGVGRYLQILRENFPDWTFTDNCSLITHNSTFINPFFSLLKPPLAMKRMAKKQIAVIHDLIPLKYPSHFPIGLKGSLNVFLNKMVLRNYDAVITDSEHSKKDIVAILKIKPEKVKVIYPCLPRIFVNGLTDSPRFVPPSGTSRGERVSELKSRLPDSKFCLYVGDATWNKNLVNLAKAVKLANVNCVLVGKVFERAIGGPSGRDPDSAQRSEHWREGNLGQNLLRASHAWQKELRDFLYAVHNDKRFHFLGYISDEELINIYRKAAVNLLVSRDEGFGFSYVEAAFQAVPSLLSDIPVFREIAGPAAFYCLPDDPKTIARQIAAIFSDSTKATAMGQTAKRRVARMTNSQFTQSLRRLVDS
ncbi:glycosyltransferase family 4 protein [Patescibacteria group bacterium]|nr:glycosyltransferase family 4 protein [Patescibacteria group bacterium]MCL5091520.1 glycosyltransferase family 4 protein [Patescibacteria group bacterium]